MHRWGLEVAMKVCARSRRSRASWLKTAEIRFGDRDRAMGKRCEQIGEVDSHRLVLLPSHALVVFGMSATSMFLPMPSEARSPNELLHVVVKVLSVAQLSVC